MTGGLVEALVADSEAGNLTSECGLLQPSAQSACNQAATGAAPPGVSYQNFGLGYIAIGGTQALVGTVGTCWVQILDVSVDLRLLGEKAPRSHQR